MPSVPPKKKKSHRAIRLRNRILYRQKRAAETPEEAEIRRAAARAKAARYRASIPYEEAQRRRIEAKQRNAARRAAKKKAEQRRIAAAEKQAALLHEKAERRRIHAIQRQATRRAALSNEKAEQRKIQATQRQAIPLGICYWPRAAMPEEEKYRRKLEHAKSIATFKSSVPEGEKEQKKVGNSKKGTVVRVRKRVELSDHLQTERMASVNQALRDEGIISFPVYPVFNSKSNTPVQVYFAQNQQLYEQNGWSTLMPNAVPTIIPNYPVNDNVFHWNSTNGVHTEKDKTVQIKMEFLEDSSEQFEKVEKLNGCGGQPNSSIAGVLPKNDEHVQIKMEFAVDTSEQLDKLNNGCRGQRNSSTNGVPTEKNETVQIKMEYLDDSSEQLEKMDKLNDCGGQPNSSTAGVHLEKDENVQIKMEFAEDSSEQLGTVEPWNMFTLELSTPNINIEKQKDIVIPTSVSGSISNSSDPSNKSDNALASFKLIL